MKAICYISNFAKDITKQKIDELVEFVNYKNKIDEITGILIVRNKYFFQIIEGDTYKIDTLYQKIRKDNRHTGVITLLDTPIDARLFDDYNSGKFEIFQKYADMKKLHLYFSWIKEAEYLPANKIIQLTSNFLKQTE